MRNVFSLQMLTSTSKSLLIYIYPPLFIGIKILVEKYPPYNLIKLQILIFSILIFHFLKESRAGSIECVQDIKKQLQYGNN